MEFGDDVVAAPPEELNAFAPDDEEAQALLVVFRTSSIARRSSAELYEPHSPRSAVTMRNPMLRGGRTASSGCCTLPPTPFARLVIISRMVAA